MACTEISSLAWLNIRSGWYCVSIAGNCYFQSLIKHWISTLQDQVACSYVQLRKYVFMWILTYNRMHHVSQTCNALVHRFSEVSLSSYITVIKMLKSMMHMIFCWILTWAGPWRRSCTSCRIYNQFTEGWSSMQVSRIESNLSLHFAWYTVWVLGIGSFVHLIL